MASSTAEGTRQPSGCRSLGKGAAAICPPGRSPNEAVRPRLCSVGVGSRRAFVVAELRVLLARAALVGEARSRPVDDVRTPR